MKLIGIYIILATLMNITYALFPRFISSLRNDFTQLVIDISYPITKTLSVSQDIVDKYLILVNVQEENKELKRELAKCRIYNDILQKKINDKNKNTFRLLSVPFSFKGNFKTDTIYLHIERKLDLDKKYCVVLSEKLGLIGIIEKKTGKNVYSAKTVFNPSFVADVFILSNKKRYKALFIGNPYLPKVEFLDPNVDVNENDAVYTSGDFNIYPPGLYIGKVSSVKDVSGYYKMAYIKIDRSFFNNWKVFVLCRRK